MHNKISDKTSNKMSPEKFKREKLYQAAAVIAKTMLNKGLITAEGHSSILTMLCAKYSPCLAGLYAAKADKPQTNC